MLFCLKSPRFVFIGIYTVFERIDFNIHLPENVDVGLDNIFVYTGFSGETNESKEYDINYEDGVFKARSLPRFKSYTGQNVTVLLNLPLGSVKEIKPWWPFWTDYGWTLILGAQWSKFRKKVGLVKRIQNSQG